jgi:DNA-binding NarL/FixJ family response regulator
LEVLEKASRGFTNVEIGRQMNISTYAVKWHLSSIYRKLGVSNRTEAASAYHREMSELALVRREV